METVALIPAARRMTCDALLYFIFLTFALTRIRQWNWIASNAKDQGFPSIRLTGFDCNALDLASRAAAQYGLTVLAGIYINVRWFIIFTYYPGL